MRVFRMIGPCALMLLPVLATAGPPMDAAVIGQIEAKRDFCERVDPSGTKDRAGFISALMGPLSAEDLQAAHDSESYKNSYEQTSAQLRELDPQGAKSACALGAR